MSSSNNKNNSKKEQPFCGFAVKPKYPVNTRLRKHFPGYGHFEGRVTGFDGEYYEILYEDGDGEVFDVTGFDSVEILQPKKNDVVSATIVAEPTVPSTTAVKRQHEIPTCPICTEEFSGDTSNRDDGQLPIQAIHCPHVICKDCVSKMHVLHESSFTKHTTKFVDCPICKRPKSFNVQQPTVCLTMCEMVELCQKINQQHKDPPATDVATEIRRRRMLRAAEERYESAKRQCIALPGANADATIPAQPMPNATSRTNPKRQAIATPNAAISTKKNGSIAVAHKTSDTATPDAAPSSQPFTHATVLICTACQTARKLKKFPHDQVRRGLKDRTAKIWCADCLLQCSCCRVSKPKEKYSSKQWDQSKRNALCRRCEDKAIIRKRFGRKVRSITIQMVKIHPERTKAHLATAVRWPLAPAEADQPTDLPDDLVLDGYSRDDWALLDNNPENVWSIASLLLFGNKATGFVQYLKENRKSAYATFKLPTTGQDGFFVIPYDQPQLAKSENGESLANETLVYCKYVVGLGLGLDEPATPTDGPRNEPGETQNVGRQDEEDYVSASQLSRLLFKARKTDQAVAGIPQAAARKYIQKQNVGIRPDVSTSRGGVADWYRPSTVMLKKRDDDVNQDSE